MRPPRPSDPASLPRAPETAEVAEPVVEIDLTDLARPDWETLVAHSPDVIAVTTTDGVYRHVSPSSARVLGWRPDELEGRHEQDFTDAEDLPLLAAHRIELLAQAGGAATTSYRFRSENGSTRWVEVSSRLTADEAGPVVLSTMRDITERQRHNTALQQQASTDPLTGLSNRVVLLDRLRQGIRRLERSPGVVAVLGLDLDRFKVVNDALGHAAGDEVLLMLAERLSHHVRPADTLARLGGDEFVIVAEGLSTGADIDRLAFRVISSGRVPFVVDGQPLACTVSVGVASTADPRCDPQELLREADLALYRAKDHGRDRAEFFDDQLRTQALGRVAAERLVRAALEGGRLAVHYQPVVDLRTRRVVAAEALVRLLDEQGRLVLPNEFLEVAEATGLLADIDALVMRDALVKGARWNAPGEGAPVDVTLNLTARHLADADFHESVLKHLQAAGLAPCRLQVDVPERVLMETSNSSRDGLQALRDAGVQVGLDDFGTGHSSLSYLGAVPLDFLKIDRSLVEQLPASATARAVVAGILGVAATLDLTVTAEGVETAQQLAVVEALGCERAQGFLFSPALEPTELEPLLALPAATS